jgi:hypothetical protein
MRKLAIAFVLVLLGGAGWRMMHDRAPDATLLFDRFWIDHEPKSPPEKFQVLWVSAEMPFGHFTIRDMWTGQWEGFHYHVPPKQPGELDFLFGRTNERQRVKYTARRCQEQGFDYCLDITGSSRGVKRYFSKKEWQSTSGASAPMDALAAGTDQR